MRSLFLEPSAWTSLSFGSGGSDLFPFPIQRSRPPRASYPSADLPFVLNLTVWTSPYFRSKGSDLPCTFDIGRWTSLSEIQPPRPRLALISTTGPLGSSLDLLSKTSPWPFKFGSGPPRQTSFEEILTVRTSPCSDLLCMSRPPQPSDLLVLQA